MARKNKYRGAGQANWNGNADQRIGKKVRDQNEPKDNRAARRKAAAVKRKAG